MKLSPPDKILVSFSEHLQSDQTAEAPEGVYIKTTNAVVGQVAAGHRKRNGFSLCRPHCTHHNIRQNVN